MLKRPAAERLQLLRNAEGPQGQFLWAILRNSFHYAAVHLATIAETARDVDQAMRWGFGMKQGPFELWQEAGLARGGEDGPGGHRRRQGALQSAAARLGVQGPGGRRGRCAHGAGILEPPPRASSKAACNCPCTSASIFPNCCWGEAGPKFETAGSTLEENDSIRVWTLDGQVLIASIKTKMHAISPEVCEGLMAAVDLAEKEYQGLVIWSGDEPFSAGADLQAMLPAFMAVGVSAIEDAEGFMQQTMLRLRYANVPVVSAVRGLALGGGCELAVYSARRVGPHGKLHRSGGSGRGPGACAGGLTYIARRAAENAETSTGKDLLPFLTEGFTAAAMAKVGHQRTGVEKTRLRVALRRDRAAQGRAPVCRHQRGQGAVQRRLPCAAQAPVPRGRPRRQNHHPGQFGPTCATVASSASTTSTSPR